MKFGKLLARCVSVSVPAWREKFMDYKVLKKLLYAISLTKKEHPPRSTPSTTNTNTNSVSSITNSSSFSSATASTTINSPLQTISNEVESPEVVIRRLMSNPGEVKFFRQIRYELRKVAVHFALCEAQLCERYIQLISALENFIVHRTSTSTPNGNTNITMTNEDIGTEARRLLAMVVKLSSFAIQLENYAVMNYCGFGKALKKHDKITGESTKLAVMQAWVNVQSFAEYPILLKLLSGIEEAWRLLVALQPEEASINMVDNDEAKTLMNLHHVKSFSNMHRAKEMAERHTSTSSLSLNSIPSSPSVYPRGPSNNGLSIHPANDSTTTNLLTNIYPLTHHSGSSSVQPMHNNTTGSNYIHPYNGSDAHTLQTNRSMKRELEHTTVGISSTTPSSSGSTLYSSSSSNVISSSSSNVTPPNVHTNNNDSSVGSSTSTTGKRRRVGTHV